MDLVTLILACSLYADNSVPYAMVGVESKNAPWLLTVDNQAKKFKTESEAVSYTKAKIAEGKKVNIGLMQIPSQWLPEVRADVRDLYRPCKNMVIATQIMNKLYLQCQTLAAQKPTINIQACMLSLYKTGDTQAGVLYANKVLRFVDKHPPFSTLAKKARDPGMLAAEAKHKVTALTANAKSIEST